MYVVTGGGVVAGPKIILLQKMNFERNKLNTNFWQAQKGIENFCKKIQETYRIDQISKRQCMY